MLQQLLQALVAVIVSPFASNVDLQSVVQLIDAAIATRLFVELKEGAECLVCRTSLDCALNVYRLVSGMPRTSTCIVLPVRCVQLCGLHAKRPLASPANAFVSKGMADDYACVQHFGQCNTMPQLLLCVHTLGFLPQSRHVLCTD